MQERSWARWRLGRLVAARKGHGALSTAVGQLGSWGTMPWPACAAVCGSWPSCGTPLAGATDDNISQRPGQSTAVRVGHHELCPLARLVIVGNWALPRAKA